VQRTSRAQAEFKRKAARLERRVLDSRAAAAAAAAREMAEEEKRVAAAQAGPSAGYLAPVLGWFQRK
jgi:hypothetical protein